MSSADLDGDHVIDYLYAGDLLGNVWRFDLTSTNPADWAASTYGHPSATPLFTALSSTGAAQPITTALAVTATYTGGAYRVILGFGTGVASPISTASTVTYATGQQTVYGIWDWDMTNWDHGTVTASLVTIKASSVQYAALSELIPPTPPTVYRTSTVTNASLYVDVLVSQSGGTRTIAQSTVCWEGSTTCTTTANNQYGWLFQLPSTGEQVIYSPAFTGGEMILNTTIPPSTTLGQCSPTLPTGYTMAFNIASGGGAPLDVFPNSLGNFTVQGTAPIVGVELNSVGTPFIVSVGSQQYAVNPNVSGGQANISKINPQGGVIVTPLTREQIR